MTFAVKGFRKILTAEFAKRCKDRRETLKIEPDWSVLESFFLHIYYTIVNLARILLAIITVLISNYRPSGIERTLPIT
ncbi:MAG: hypothetical protein DMG97_13580 [Acidobacteria bacterium]|nr:MAG: hypothetical protein DMG97_13580 [Acidobacteriota bacterium]PYV76597.1 MAG: hypothetical protein DMG96_13585 [Acidobacteriota bacterium]